MSGTCGQLLPFCITGIDSGLKETTLLHSELELIFITIH
jgi:hypothetical protein